MTTAGSTIGTFERFLVERVRPNIALVTMNRPEKLNAMDPTFFRELIDVMGLITDTPDVSVAILTGAGRAFSAGGDIATFPVLTENLEKARMHLRTVFDSFNAIERCRVPVIAAVNGIAHGGGLEILGGVDYRIASSNANLAFREAVHGLIPSYGVVKFQEIIGHARTMRLVGSAEIIDAHTALEWDVVQEVVGPDELMPRAIALAESLAANPATALHTLKNVLNRDSSRDLAIAVEATALLFGMPDTQSRVKAFLDRKRS
jgi:enoyl-CoA hydratase